MSDAATIPKAHIPWFRQRWPWLLIAGPAIVVVAGTYTGWLALSTDDGLVADDYYKRGLTINKRLERVDRAAALQLSARLDVAADGGVRVAMASPSLDAQAMPAVVRLAITHPTRAGLDRSAELLRGPDGIYAGRVEPVPPGRWLVIVETDAWRLPLVEVAGELRDVRLGATPAAAHS
jgi:uncharacterized protein